MERPPLQEGRGLAGGLGVGVQDSSPRWLLAAKAAVNQSPSLLGCLPLGKAGSLEEPLISYAGHFTIWCCRRYYETGTSTSIWL